MTDRFAEIDVCVTSDGDACFFEGAPSGTEMTCFRMAKGIANAAEYPADAALQMESGHPGRIVADVIGNTRGLLIVSDRVKATIEEFQGAETEYLPLRILNHKGRPALGAGEPAHHWIVNPLGTFDAADHDASEIDWFEGDVVDVDELVLSPAKVEGAPALFRPAVEPRSYIVRGALADRLASMGLRGLVLKDLEVARG